MKKWNGRIRLKKKMWLLLCGIALLLILGGCGRETAANENTETNEETEAMEEGKLSERKTGIGYESAQDAEVDFTALKQENPDIFAWLYIPEVNVDGPVLQSEEADDYYESHNAYGEEDNNGAFYTELANLKSMCDFNTVIHGKNLDDGGSFSQLVSYMDKDFMEENGEVYLYLDGNLLTYEVFAAYERENTSLIRTYDFTYISGCQAFLDDLYNTRVMGKVIRDGWEEVTPYHFLITLTTESSTDPDKQYIVVAALVQDAAGTIDRAVTE